MLKSSKAQSALGSFPDETNTINIGLAQPKDAARTDTDTCVSDVRYCVQAVIVASCSDDLDTGQYQLASIGKYSRRPTLG